MADSANTGLGFRIRPIPRQAPEPLAAELPPPPAALAPVATDGLTHTGGLFRSAQAVLVFLGAVAGARLSDEARAWRGPDRRWWTEVRVPWQHAGALVANAGGLAYAGQPDIIRYRWPARSWRYWCHAASTGCSVARRLDTGA